MVVATAMSEATRDAVPAASAFRRAITQQRAAIANELGERMATDALQDPIVQAAFAEFVRTDYALTLCTYCNVNPPDRGQIRSIFPSVRLLGGQTLDVRLNAAITQKSEPLMDRLAKHLRARVPHIKRLQYQARRGSWGQLRTWYLN